jgi:hypothetical protein
MKMFAVILICGASIAALSYYGGANVYVLASAEAQAYDAAGDAAVHAAALRLLNGGKIAEAISFLDTQIDEDLKLAAAHDPWLRKYFARLIGDREPIRTALCSAIRYRAEHPTGDSVVKAYVRNMTAGNCAGR